MTLLEKLQQKLRLHSDRIKDGKNDEFDYLPAVLHHLMEEQNRQSKTTNELVDQARHDVKAGVDSIRGDVRTGVDSIRADVKANSDSMSADLKNGVGSIKSGMDSGFASTSADFKTGIDSVRSDLRAGVASLKGDIRTGVESLNEYLIEMNAGMARERLKTQRFLLAGLILAVLTLGGVFTIAILLYTRR